MVDNTEVVRDSADVEEEAYQREREADEEVCIHRELLLRGTPFQYVGAKNVVYSFIHVVVCCELDIPGDASIPLVFLKALLHGIVLVLFV